MPHISQVASRSTLRDGIRRLEELRVSCGKESGPHAAAQFKPTGDPFTDRAELFRLHAKSCGEAIKERSVAASTVPASPESETAKAREHNAVLANLDKMTQKVDEMEAMVSAANNKAFRAQEKGRAPEKMQELQRVAQSRTNTVRDCRRILEDLKKLAKSSKESDDKAPNSPNRGSRRNFKVRAAMETLARAQKQHVDMGAVQSLEAAAASSAAALSSPYGVDEDDDRPDIATAVETRQKYQQLQHQREEIDRGLDRLSATIMRVRHQAITIGEELEAQNQQLEQTQAKVQDQADKVKKLRKKVDTVLKKQAPSNVCINIFLFVLLLFLIGYFLVKFKAVRV